MPTLATMAETVGTLLKERSETVAVSESSTGGLIAAALLALPGRAAIATATRRGTAASRSAGRARA
jgi:nicotinamide mononucleotide (NMN) deamidase PncC